MKVGINSPSMLAASTRRFLQGQVWDHYDGAEWRNPMEKHAGLTPAYPHEGKQSPTGANY